MSAIPSLSDLEALPVGRIKTSVPSVPPWCETGHAAFDEMIGRFLDEATTTDRLDLSALRYVAVSEDLPKDVMSWQRALKTPVIGVTQGVEVVGKVIHWKSQDARAHSLVILDQRVVGGAYDGMAFWRAPIFHELAHVHDDLRRQATDSEHPTRFDLPGIERFIAEILWSEFFAEVVGSRQLDEESGSLAWGSQLEIGAELIGKQKRRLLAYRISGDIDSFWDETITRASTLAGLLGRALGVLAAAKLAPEDLDDGLTKLKGLHECAEELALAADRGLCSLFRANHDWVDGSGLVPALIPAVRLIWRVMGVSPTVRPGDEFYVHVPFSWPNKRVQDQLVVSEERPSEV